MTSILHLRLQPDNIPVTDILDWATSSEQVLVVSPGERSQMTLHLHNPIEETLEIELEVRGNFPPQWCHWNVEGKELRFRETMLVGIYFDVPHWSQLKLEEQLSRGFGSWAKKRSQESFSVEKGTGQ